MTKVYCRYCHKDGEVSFADGQCKWIYVACPHCNKTGGLRRPEKHPWESSYSNGINPQSRKDLQDAARILRGAQGGHHMQDNPCKTKGRSALLREEMRAREHKLFKDMAVLLRDMGSNKTCRHNMPGFLWNRLQMIIIEPEVHEAFCEDEE